MSGAAAGSRGGARTKKRHALLLLFTYTLRFLTVALIVTAAVLLYHTAAEAFGEGSAWTDAVMLVAIVFLSLAVTVLDLILHRVTTERPVGRIAESACRIAAGDFTVRQEPAHPYGRYDAYDCILLDLNRAAAELAESEKTRLSFISNVSHELKTPLAVIQSYAQTLARGGLDEATQREYLGVLSDTAERLASLVHNVLRLNRLEHRRLLAELSDVRLDEQLAQCILQFDDVITQKGLELVCDLDEVTIRSDEGCLELVWNNLLSNAVKFTDAGQIGVTLKREQGRAVVTVSDTGCGMSAETGKHIFEQFYQGDTSHAKEGNGLGLALVRKVIDVLGGEIAVESEEGKGSTFRVTLPERI